MDEQDQILKDAFLALPKVLQEAITNADVQANLRKLADVHKLHLDKWAVLENEIMMALLGITSPQELPHAISEQVGIPLAQAQEITNSVAEIVFDPIQDELKGEVGESRNTLENIDYVEPNQMTTKGSQPPLEQNNSNGQPKPIDISKFSPAPTNPAEYKPQTTKKYAANNDPYHETIE